MDLLSLIITSRLSPFPKFVLVLVEVIDSLFIFLQSIRCRVAAATGLSSPFVITGSHRLNNSYDRGLISQKSKHNFPAMCVTVIDARYKMGRTKIGQSTHDNLASCIDYNVTHTSYISVHSDKELKYPKVVELCYKFSSGLPRCWFFKGHITCQEQLILHS